MKKFHNYLVQASICNRRTDVNYTNLKVTESRNELNKTLNFLGIAASAVGFLPGKAPVIADNAIKILALALSIEPRFSLAEFIYPIKGPVYLEGITELTEYKRENSNGYISSQKKIANCSVENDVLKELEEYGLKIKK